MDDDTIEKRKFILNEFLKGLCGYRYLASTPEVQIFLRPKSTVIETLKTL